MTTKDLSLAIFLIGIAAVVALSQQRAPIGAGDLTGIWRTGGQSMMADKNMITGATTPSNGNTFKYMFTADGRFEFVGYMQSTMYGCTTDLFNDKRGKYVLNGDQLTLSPTKNFWRNTYSCSPASNKERNYTLEQETMTLSGKTDEYGSQYICLQGKSGETCYRRSKD